MSCGSFIGNHVYAVETSTTMFEIILPALVPSLSEQCGIVSDWLVYPRVEGLSFESLVGRATGELHIANVAVFTGC